jgi:CheY-like chemotaxis protein
LDFSKIEAGKLSLEKKSFDLNIILSYLADMTSLKAKEKGIILTFDIDNKMGKNYLGDSLRISQILLNLIGNAIKFTDKGSVQLRIKTVDSADRKSTIQFEVSDTGIGISQEQLENIFQSYTQASDDTSRKYGGSGLGLKISKQLAEIMDAQIWVESELGIGTTFFVKITLDSDNEKRNYRLPSKDIMQMKVLIIDSNLESTDSLTNLITYFHMPVTTASNIDDAKILMNENKFDIVFVDAYMFDSIDIQSYKSKNSANIVLIDDWKNILKSENTYSMGVDEILKRPFTQQMVFEILSSLYNINGIPNNTHQTDIYNKESVKMLGKHQILIAEDNHINQKVMSGLLAGTELEIEFADDGQKAFDKLQNSATLYELIFMDINMPNLDGYMATQMIRKNSLFDNIPIVGLSAYGTDEDLKKAKDVGMQEYLQKPIDVKSLYEILIKYLK